MYRVKFLRVVEGIEPSALCHCGQAASAALYRQRATFPPMPVPLSRTRSSVAPLGRPIDSIRVPRGGLPLCVDVLGCVSLGGEVFYDCPYPVHIYSVCWKAFWMCSRSRFLHFARKRVGCSVLPLIVDCTMSGPCPVVCVLPCLSLCAVFHPGVPRNEDSFCGRVCWGGGAANRP